MSASKRWVYAAIEAVDGPAGLKILRSAARSHGHIEAGMSVLTKPFTMEVLASRVQGLLH